MQKSVIDLIEIQCREKLDEKTNKSNKENNFILIFFIGIAAGYILGCVIGLFKLVINSFINGIECGLEYLEKIYENM